MVEIRQIETQAKCTFLSSAAVFLLLYLTADFYSALFWQNILKYVGMAYFSMVSGVCLGRFVLKKRTDSMNKAVFITGCDTGFGNELAKRLYLNGFSVFAGCLQPDSSGASDLMKMNTGDSNVKLHVMKLDVTIREDIEAAKDYIVKNIYPCELWAIVNNAGIAKGSHFDKTSLQDIEDVIDVNTAGVIRATKIFLPLIQKSGGRIINVASVAGRIPWYSFTAYSLSKHAVIAFSDILRFEVQKWGIHVVTIEPWLYNTRIANFAAIAQHIKEGWKPKSDKLKDENNMKEVSNFMKYLNIIGKNLNYNINEVIDVMEAAVMEEVPDYSYSSGKWYLRLFLFIVSGLPQHVRDFIFCYIQK